MEALSHLLLEVSVQWHATLARGDGLRRGAELPPGVIHGHLEAHVMHAGITSTAMTSRYQPSSARSSRGSQGIFVCSSLAKEVRLSTLSTALGRAWHLISAQ